MNVVESWSLASRGWLQREGQLEQPELQPVVEEPLSDKKIRCNNKANAPLTMSSTARPCKS